MEPNDFTYLQKHTKFHFHECIRSQATRDGDSSVSTWLKTSFHIFSGLFPGFKWEYLQSACIVCLGMTECDESC